MPRWSWVVPVALCSLLAAAPAFAGDVDDASIKSDPVGLSVSARLSVGAPIQAGGVTVFPVIDRHADKEDPDDAYLTLSEALRVGTLRVTEDSDGGAVARLRVHNTGKSPVLVMAGEVVAGGRQDRVITEDVVIPSTDRPIAIEVNCVEPGRWASHARLGDRFGYGGRAELALRRVVQVERSQDATWRTVAFLNDSKAGALHGEGAGLDPATGTYMASIRSVGVDRRVDKLRGELMERLEKVHGAVGMVVAFEGRVVASEVYAHPQLFERVAGGSIDAVARDAVSRGIVDAEPARPSAALAARFLSDAVVAPGVARPEIAGEVAAGAATVSYALHDDDGNLVHLASYLR